MNPRSRLYSRLAIAAIAVAIAAAFFVASQSRDAPLPASPEIHVAVAANFSDAFRDLARRFEEMTDAKVTPSFGSTGSLYAQIKNGAPFAAFFSSDADRPVQLEQEGLAVAGTRFTYAIGKVVLWSPRPDYVDPQGIVLDRGDFRHLAISNPDLAPYGRAAQQVLEARGLWNRLQDRLVRGENISQTYQFVHSGSAELGFVAWSQLKLPGVAIEGSFWDVPQSLYTPIEQQAVLLKNDTTARAFLDFVRSDEAADIIHSYGYNTHP